MAAVLRTGLANLNPISLLGGLCKVIPKHHNGAITQVAYISSKEVRVGRPPKPPPFDWRNKRYGRWAYMTDPMEERIDDNTKVVVLEGLPAVGKDKVARQLAEELEMTYIPPPDFKDIYETTQHGFDLRSLNPRLPVDAQFFDIESFLKDPKGSNTPPMQLSMFAIRTNQYIDALVELFSTGNGVILQRCPYSDILFMDAMLKNGYVTKGAYAYYKRAFLTTVQELMRPHLIIYLDAPISVIKDNIKKRNIPYEVNSPALTDKYLEDLSTLYKEQYLREASKQSHLLIYDWSTPGDVSVVVEDIERLEFDDLKPTEEKFADWKHDHIYHWKVRRGEYAHYKEDILLNMYVPNSDVPEMMRSQEDGTTLEEVIQSCPDADYQPGFNPEKDKGLLWKLNDKWIEWQRVRKAA